MMNRRALFVIVVLLIAGAYFLGRHSAPRLAASSPVKDDLAVRPTATAVSTPRLDDPSLETAASRGLRTKIEQLGHAAGSERNEEERLRLLAEWAAHDPQAALAYAQKNFKQDRLAQAQTAVFTKWAQTAPEAAWNWVAQRPSEAANLDLVIDEIGKQNPNLAGQLAAHFAQEHPGAAQEVYLAALQGMAYAGNFTEAQQIVSSFSVGTADEHASLVNFLAGQWARYQPQQAALWIEAMAPGSARDQALTNLTESWSDADPAQAASFAIDLPPGPVRQTALKQAISKWLAEDPDQARSWVVNANVHEDFDQAVVSIATDTNLMNRQPSRALQWAATIFDDRLRIQSLGTILTTLAIQDRSAAQNYVQASSDLSADQKSQLLRQLNPTP
jgi:hypothetical protein